MVRKLSFKALEGRRVKEDLLFQNSRAPPQQFSPDKSVAPPPPNLPRNRTERTRARVGGLGILRGDGGFDRERERGNLHTQRPLIIHFSKGGAAAAEGV